MKFLVDSSVWIDYFNGFDTEETAFLDAALGYEQILVGDIILSEVLQGFRRDVDFDRALRALLLFEQVSLINQTIAIESAKNYRHLRKMGITVRKTIDVFIATWCILNQTPLLHGDRDFSPFENYLGLMALHPGQRG